MFQTVIMSSSEDDFNAKVEDDADLFSRYRTKKSTKAPRKSHKKPGIRTLHLHVEEHRVAL